MKGDFNLLLQIDDFVSKNKLYSKKDIKCFSDLLDCLQNVRFFIRRVDDFEYELEKQLQSLDDLAIGQSEVSCDSE